MTIETTDHNRTKESCSAKMLLHSHEVLPVNVEFENLIYKTGNKQLLKSMSGKFRAGEMTAVLGASGAGKTTLLNILSGHVQQNVSGNILLNGKKKKLTESVYISDDTLLQPLLTVKEAMTIPAQLKLKGSTSKQEREVIVAKILNSIGLQDCISSRTENLSGGEKKRLSVALELINDPSVMFFDEPTSGLDIVATKNCLEVLSMLANQGRTVICTIHQPSISILQQFHQLYFIADGMCIYNGSPNKLVSFLERVDLSCPLTWNPADHIIEIAQTNNEYTSLLVSAIKNGKVNERDEEKYPNVKNLTHQESLTKTTNCISCTMPFYRQFHVLLRRMMLQQFRSRFILFLQLFYHVVVSLSLGTLFYNVGNNAEYALASMKMCIGVIIAVVYTQIMIPLLVYPKELKLLTKEYSNKWYDLFPYYTALTVRNMPVMFLCTAIFLIISLTLADLPLDLDRFVFYYVICILLAIGSEGLGIMASVMPNIRDGVVVGITTLFFCLIFSIYNMYYREEPSVIEKILMNVNYMKNAQVAFYITLFRDRPPLSCSEIYCYFSDSNNILKSVQYDKELFSNNMLSLIACVIALRFGAYLALRYKLSHAYSKMFN